MDKLLYFLHTVYPLSPALRGHLREIVKTKSIAKKEYLLRPGQVARNMHFISRGLLRAYYLRGYTEVSSWFMKEGDICVSIESFYQQRESYEFIQAIEDTTLYYIDYQELEKIYKDFPEFNRIGRVLTIKYLALWAEQLRAIRMQSAAERYGWLLEYNSEILLRVPHKYIASYLDITPETLSKIRGETAYSKPKLSI
jgi:CRP/FNR family transcriptional regulator, anaerobic regulatory protein